MAYKVVTIDGPAGSGKSTIAKQLSKKLNFVFINSGGIFRCISLYILNNNIPLEEDELNTILKKIKVTQKKDKMFLNGKDVSDVIYSKEITDIVPKIASLKIIRDFVLESQRQTAKNDNIVVEGRDTGTSVFPNADYKFWLFANIDVRAERRWLQSNKKYTLEEVKIDLKKRDFEDSTRKISPMVKPKNAIEIDTSYITEEEAISKILEYIKL